MKHTARLWVGGFCYMAKRFKKYFWSPALKCNCHLRFQVCYDKDHYLVTARIRERLSVINQEKQNF